jgi:hypothetical protein
MGDIKGVGRGRKCNERSENDIGVWYPCHSVESWQLEKSARELQTRM